MGYKKDNEKDNNMMGVYVSNELYAKIEAISKRTGHGVSRTVRDILISYFEMKESNKYHERK
jgi:predicted DNA-binding protein